MYDVSLLCRGTQLLTATTPSFQCVLPPQSKSLATERKNTAEITPFIVKKAALRRDRSEGETSKCCQSRRRHTAAKPIQAIMSRTNVWRAATKSRIVAKCIMRANQKVFYDQRPRVCYTIPLPGHAIQPGTHTAHRSRRPKTPQHR